MRSPNLRESQIILTIWLFKILAIWSVDCDVDMDDSFDFRVQNIIDNHSFWVLKK